MSAQIIDEGVFSIRHDGREIGRENFTIRTGRGPDGNTAGTTISAITRYPALDPRTTIAVVLERTITGHFTVFQLEYDTPEVSERYLAGQDRGRITIHRFADGSQSAREYPGGENAFVQVDSVFVLHQVLIDLATQGGGNATAYLARSGRRTLVRVAPLGTDNEGQVVTIEGDRNVQIWLDDAGRIQRMEFPASSLTIVRLRN
jgi:hypothetical protein